MLNGKDTIICLTVWYDRWNIHSINEWIFPKTKIFKSRRKSWKRFVYSCNKSRFKNATGVDTSASAKKSDLAHLKSDVDK